jgi:hypothetical protein
MLPVICAGSFLDQPDMGTHSCQSKTNYGISYICGNELRKFKTLTLREAVRMVFLSYSSIPTIDSDGHS